jgi:phytoene dehydrogenase-like protein
MRVIVVGAGVAGLVCARTLLRAGAEVTVFEADDSVGGRVRSDVVEGFVLDRGFQVLFTAYPAARRQLDYERLDLRAYEPGAVIAQGAERHILTDPFRDPGSAVPALLTGIVPTADKLRTLRLTQELRAASVEAFRQAKDQTTESFLLRYGFSHRYLDNFIRPFFGGIFLDRSLSTSARSFQFYWKMLSEGDTAVPAGGMGAISMQLAEELARAERIRCDARVRELVFSASGTAAGVRLATGETEAAEAIVLATPAPEAARLSGLPMPAGQLGTMTLYLAGDASLWSGGKIFLHANREPFINNAAMVTNSAPEQAPEGKHLLSLTALGIPPGDDASLYDRALTDLRRMLAGDRAALNALETYRPLALYRIPYAQFAQPPGVADTLPENRTSIPGLYFAAEFTGGSSINAALESGEKAAALLLAK